MIPPPGIPAAPNDTATAIRLNDKEKKEVIIEHIQKPITRSFCLQYETSESTLSRIFLFLEAPPRGSFTGVFMIANKRSIVGHCLRHTKNTLNTKVFQ